MEVFKDISEHVYDDKDIVFKLTDQSVDIPDQPANKKQNYGERKEVLNDISEHNNNNKDKQNKKNVSNCCGARSNCCGARSSKASMPALDRLASTAVQMCLQSLMLPFLTSP